MQHKQLCRYRNTKQYIETYGNHHVSKLTHILVQNGRQDDTDEETYMDAPDDNDYIPRDCTHCGIRIDTVKQMGVQCELLCDMYFHKSCQGQCDCGSNTDTHSGDDTDVEIDLTMMNEDSEPEYSDDDTEQGDPASHTNFNTCWQCLRMHCHYTHTPVHALTPVVPS